MFSNLPLTALLVLPEDPDDLGFLLCLTPPPPTADWTIGQTVLDAVVRTFQPSPEIVHCELLLPSSSDPSAKRHFASYIGKTGRWYDDDAGQHDFYLGTNAQFWRAIPITLPKGTAAARDECDRHVETPYSLLRYAFSAPPLRAFAGLLPDRALAPAHCATLSARILQTQLPLAHSAAWYGPSTLSLEMSTGAIAKGTAAALSSSNSTDDAVARTVETLARGSDAAIAKLVHTDCASAVRHLAARVASRFDSDDAAGEAIAQRQLATALLRWSLTASES